MARMAQTIGMKKYRKTSGVEAPNVEPYSCSYYGTFVAQFMCLIDT